MDLAAYTMKTNTREPHNNPSLQENKQVGTQYIQNLKRKMALSTPTLPLSEESNRQPSTEKTGALNLGRNFQKEEPSAAKLPTGNNGPIPRTQLEIFHKTGTPRLEGSYSRKKAASRR